MSAAAIPVHAAKTGCRVGYFDAARVPRIALGDHYCFPLPRTQGPPLMVGRQLDQTGRLTKLWVERASDLYGVAGFSLD